MKILKSYTRFLQKYHVWVLVAWCLFIVPCFIFELQNVVILVQTTDGSPVYDPPTQNGGGQGFLFDLSMMLLNRTLRYSGDQIYEDSPLLNKKNPFVPGGVISYWTFKSFLTYKDYYTQNLTNVLLSPNHTSGLITVESIADASNDNFLFDGILALRQWLAEYEVPPRYTVGVTGVGDLIVDARADSIEDLEKMDAIVLPIALIIIAYFLKSIKLMLIPVISFVFSVVTSFGVLYPFAVTIWHVSAFAPSFQMSMSIALSIDYSLFLLSRYRLAIFTKKKPVDEAVAEMIQFAGETIIVSGITLGTTLATLLFFPVELLVTLGGGAVICLLSTVLVNLTITPSLLLAFPEFFSKPIEWKKLYHSWCGGEEEIEDFVLQDALLINEEEPGFEDFMSEDLDFDGLSGGGVHKGPKLTIDPASMWFKSASFTTKWPNSLGILVVVIGLMIPLVVIFPQLFQQQSRSMANDLAFPRKSDSLKTFNELSNIFSPGKLTPFVVLAEKRPDNPLVLFSDEYFHTLHMIIDEVLGNYTRYHVLSSGITSIAYDTLRETKLNASDARRYIEEPIPNPLFPKPQDNPNVTSSGFQYKIGITTMLNNITLTSMMVNPDSIITDPDCSMLSFVVDIDPLGEKAEYLTNNFRELLETYNIDTKLWKFYLSGQPPGQVDALVMTYEYFPYLILVTMSVIFVFMGIFFQSLFVPIRLLVTLSLPVGFIFGLSLLVYRNGILDWMNFAPMHSSSGGLLYLVPVMTFSILVGLAMDYDVFLYTRIVEYYNKGYSTRASVIKGVYQTGGIITGAGTIMAIAFSGLLLSSIPAMNQIGFLLCFAVLLDTFVVRTLLVPSMISLAGKWNWWPKSSEVPEDRRKTEMVPEDIFE